MFTEPSDSVSASHSQECEVCCKCNLISQETLADNPGPAVGYQWGGGH